MNNEKKMPQNEKPGVDQKKPQSDRGIGQQHSDKEKLPQSSVKPEANKDDLAKPQSSKDMDDDFDQVDDDDDRITQRSPSRGSEPARK